jgi:hypothetical protein
LQGYFVRDASGRRITESKILQDPPQPGMVMRSALSCFGCHQDGVTISEDSVRGLAEGSEGRFTPE